MVLENDYNNKLIWQSVVNQHIKKMNNMNKQEYMMKILSLTQQSSIDFFHRIYPTGVSSKQMDTAIRQIERTLKDNSTKAETNHNIEKEFDEYKQESSRHINALEKNIKDLVQQVKDEQSLRHKLENPINLENATVQQQLDKLWALEQAGVDNWEGYDYAMELLDEFIVNHK